MSLSYLFLGTVSARPTRDRNVSGGLLKLPDGTVWLIDCGEGTQHQILRSPVRPGKIDVILITHLHGDHVFGLPGLLCTISNQRAQDRPPMRIYGPKGLRDYIRVNLKLSLSELAMNFEVHECVMDPDDETPDIDTTAQNQEIEVPRVSLTEDGVFPLITDPEGFQLWAAPLDHRAPCVGFVIQEPPTAGKLDVKRAGELGVPKGPLLGQLKGGNDVTLEDGTVVAAADCVGDPIPGRKVVILGDTCDSRQIADVARDADMLVHEATHDDDLHEKALVSGHSTPAMAGQFAADIGARLLVLTHFSARYRDDMRPDDGGEGTSAAGGDQAEGANGAGDDDDDSPKISSLVAHATEAFGGPVLAAYDFFEVAVPKRKG